MVLISLLFSSIRFISVGSLMAHFLIPCHQSLAINFMCGAKKNKIKKSPHHSPDPAVNLQKNEKCSSSALL